MHNNDKDDAQRYRIISKSKHELEALTAGCNIVKRLRALYRFYRNVDGTACYYDFEDPGCPYSDLESIRKTIKRMVDSVNIDIIGVKLTRGRLGTIDDVCGKSAVNAHIMFKYKNRDVRISCKAKVTGFKVHYSNDGGNRAIVESMSDDGGWIAFPSGEEDSQALELAASIILD